MTQLALYKPTSTEARIYEARKGKKVSEFSVDNLAASIFKAWEDAVGYAGQRFDAQQAKNQLMTLTRLIQNQYPNLIAAEIKLAFEMGKLGEFGDYVTVSPKTIMEWIKAYTQLEARNNVLFEEQQPKPIEPTFEEVKARNLQAMRDYFDNPEIANTDFSPLLAMGDRGRKAAFYSDAVRYGLLEQDTITDIEKIATFQAVVADFAASSVVALTKEEKAAKNALMELKEKKVISRRMLSAMGMTNEAHQAAFHKAITESQARLFEKYQETIKQALNEQSE